MKREGRQHGMVRTDSILPSPWNPKPHSRILNGFDSPATAGLFSKVPPKPTNHSKFTGKCSKPRCNACHVHPSSKSKDKTKGAHKLKSNNKDKDVLSDGFTFSGFSATEVLDHMEVDYDYEGF